VRLLTNSTGSAVGSRAYTPYGASAGTTGSATSPFGFAGEYTDTATGFQYLRARYYDPATGSFLTRDPLENITGAPYSYANGDPMINTDPTGLCFLDYCKVTHAVSRAWDDTGGKVVHEVATHPWQTVGLVAGILAASTGVGALADATILGLDASTLGAVSVGSAVVASGADIPGCVNGSAASCVGIAANLLGAGLGGVDLLTEEGSMLFGLLGSKAFSVGVATIFWDLFSSVADAQDVSSQC
jgi:RHS repeat-associated protein